MTNIENIPDVFGVALAEWKNNKRDRDLLVQYSNGEEYTHSLYRYF
jgi:hypothetical protein